MKRTTALLATTLAGALLLAACGGGGGDPLAPGSGGTPAAADTISVTSQDFPESRLVAEMYAQVLEAKGAKVERNFGVGPREVYFPGFKDGSYDLVPDYSGTLLQYLSPGATEVSSADVYAALVKAAPADLQVLEQSAAEDKDAVVVTAETAAKYGNSLDKYTADVCSQLVFGGPPEFEKRPDGLPGIKTTYGCSFKEFKQLDSGGPITVAALSDGTVQAADLFTTNPLIKEKGFVVLEDPKNNFAAQNIVPVINKSKAKPEYVTAINAVSAKLTTTGVIDLLTTLNGPDKPNLEVVAKQWLTTNGLL